MKFNIRGSKLEVTDAIRSYIESKLSKLDKYLYNAEDITANVLIKKQGLYERIEVTIPIKKMILRSEEDDKDLYAAIDKVADKLERRIRKNKTKMKKVKEVSFVEFDVPEEEESHEQIVKRKNISIKPMSEEEAILQMNLLGHEFFVFENADTGNNAVLYRRKDNDYGIIDIERD